MQTRCAASFLHRRLARLDLAGRSGGFAGGLAGLLAVALARGAGAGAGAGACVVQIQFGPSAASDGLLDERLGADCLLFELADGLLYLRELLLALGGAHQVFGDFRPGERQGVEPRGVLQITGTAGALRALLGRFCLRHRLLHEATSRRRVELGEQGLDLRGRIWPGSVGGLLETEQGQGRESEGRRERKNCRKSSAFHERTKPRVRAAVKAPGVKALVLLAGSGYTRRRRIDRP